MRHADGHGQELQHRPPLRLGLLLLVSRISRFERGQDLVDDLLLSGYHARLQRY
jgi:hypothetical protein